MKFLFRSKDGGNQSTVWGYWLVEIKSLFSIALLRFENGSREAYHNHAFNCVSWLIKGKLIENFEDETSAPVIYTPSLKPIVTKRDTFHKVVSSGRSWVLTFRGPWTKQWEEREGNARSVLESGRVIVKKDYV